MDSAAVTATGTTFCAAAVKGNIQQGCQPTTGSDFRSCPLVIVGAGLIRFQMEHFQVHIPNRLLLLTAGEV